MTKDELQVRNREIQDRMAEMNDKAYKEKREFTEEEQREWNALTREKTMNLDQLREMATDAELAKMREAEDKNAKLRELLKDNGQKREIVLTNDGSATSPVGVYSNSGAINLTIHELIPTLHEGLDLPSTLRVVTGVTGNEIWPVNVDDVEMEEVGEVEALNDQVVNFTNITPVQKRVGLKVPVSNMAIDNAAFDEFSDKGFYEGNVMLIMDRATEAELKATPKIEGAAGGFVIENGLCAGYPYVLTHYINTTLSGSTLVPTANKCIGIGYFEWFALQQHGDVRFVIDRFASAGKSIARDAAERLVGKIENIPYFIQQLGFETFRLVDDARRKSVSSADVDSAFANLSCFNRDQYEQLMLTLSVSQKKLLIALAHEQTDEFGDVYRRRYALGVSSTVNSA